MPPTSAFSCSGLSVATPASVAAFGMISLRHGLFEAKTPEYTVTCRLGDGTRAAMRESNAWVFHPREPVRCCASHPTRRVRHSALELNGDAPIRQQVQAFIRQRWAQDIPAQHFPPLLVVGCDPAGGMQVERADLAGKVPAGKVPDAQVTLRFRDGLGLAQHPHRRALLRRAGGRRARGRGVKQGRVRGIRFAEPFAQDRIHFIIARCGGEGDDAALFQVAQDALTKRCFTVGLASRRTRYPRG